MNDSVAIPVGEVSAIHVARATVGIVGSAGTRAGNRGGWDHLRR